MLIALEGRVDGGGLEGLEVSRGGIRRTRVGLRAREGSPEEEEDMAVGGRAES